MKNKKNNELAVCGFATVKTLEKINSHRIKRLYFTEEKAPLFAGLCKKLAKTKRPYNCVKDAKELEKLSGSVHHQGIVAMCEPPQVLPLTKQIAQSWAENKEHVIILDRVGNANNLGAIVRSAAFFGIKNIVIPIDESQSSITTSSYRVAEGGMEFVNIYSINSIPSLMDDMKGKMVSIGTALDAKYSTRNLKELCKDKGALVILGNEEHGISDEIKKRCDYNVIIPFANMGKQDGPCVDSLNVAQASSIILYELSK